MQSNVKLCSRYYVLLTGGSHLQQWPLCRSVCWGIRRVDWCRKLCSTSSSRLGSRCYVIRNPFYLVLLSS